MKKKFKLNVCALITNQKENICNDDKLKGIIIGSILP
jgi:hypothetical protein